MNGFVVRGHIYSLFIFYLFYFLCALLQSSFIKIILKELIIIEEKLRNYTNALKKKSKNCSNKDKFGQGL